MTDIRNQTNTPEDNRQEWADWHPVWTIHTTRGHKRKSPVTAHDYQEQHSPTRPVRLKISSLRQQTTARRRILDARLWDQLRPQQQDAALKINSGYYLMSKGRGFKISAPHLENTGGTAPADETEHQIQTVQFYLDWAKRCQQKNISHAACIDILVFGKSCAAADKDRRKRKGWAKINLFEGLQLYCKMKGWPID
jgi:hypothetical protein